MALFLVHSIDAPSRSRAVSALNIDESLAGAIRSIAAAIPSARWIGPYPRITRRGGLSSSFLTHVANLIEVPDSPTNVYDATKRLIAQRVDAALGPHSDTWSGAEVRAYVEAVNGPLDWWRSGGARRDSTTTESFPTGDASVPEENPIGPNPTKTESIPWWGYLVGAGIVATLAVAFSPAVNAIVGAGSSLAAPRRRPNPRRRPRR